MTTALRTSRVTTRVLPGYGTAVLMNLLNEAGVLPSCNFRMSQFAAAEAISGEAIRSRFSTRRGGCRRCPIGCSPRVPANGATRGVPQYETLWALGADCGIGDLGAVVSAGHACDRAGMDTISMGGTIACAMELTESGVLRGGPRFGEAGVLRDLIDATTARRGLGDELAEGSRRLAARYDRRDLAMQVKGLELPAFDPRGMTGQGLSFATSNRGGCHIRANMLGPEILGVPVLIDRFATHGKAGVLVDLQDLNAALDSLVACKFAAFAVGAEHFARLLSAVSGEAWSRAI